MNPPEHVKQIGTTRGCPFASAVARCAIRNALSALQPAAERGASLVSREGLARSLRRACTTRLCSQNFLTERRKHQLRREVRRLVGDVDDGVDLDDLQRKHTFGISQHLHYEVRLAIGCAAANRSTHAG